MFVPEKTGDCLFEKERGSARSYVRLTASKIGDDYMVVIRGGTRPHIGAVAIGAPHSHNDNYKRDSSSVSVFSLPGHRDDTIARWAAGIIAQALHHVAVVIVGIHIDNATPEEIRVLIDNSQNLVQEFVRQV